MRSVNVNVNSDVQQLSEEKNIHNKDHIKSADLKKKILSDDLKLFSLSLTFVVLYNHDDVSVNDEGVTHEVSEVVML